MTILITKREPIEKIFWFNSPPIEERNGWFVRDAVCPACGNERASIERYRIIEHQYGERLICDLCGYGEIRFRGGEDDVL